MAQTFFFALVFIGALYMSRLRFKAKERGYGYAWLICAAFNAYLLLQRIFIAVPVE